MWEGLPLLDGDEVQSLGFLWLIVQSCWCESVTLPPQLDLASSNEVLFKRLNYLTIFKVTKFSSITIYNYTFISRQKDLINSWFKCHVNIRFIKFEICKHGLYRCLEHLHEIFPHNPHFQRLMRAYASNYFFFDLEIPIHLGILFMYFR